MPPLLTEKYFSKPHWSVIKKNAISLVDVAFARFSKSGYHEVISLKTDSQPTSMCTIIILHLQSKPDAHKAVTNRLNAGTFCESTGIGDKGTSSASPNGNARKQKSSEKGFQSIKGVLDSFLDSIVQADPRGIATSSATNNKRGVRNNKRSVKKNETRKSTIVLVMEPSILRHQSKRHFDPNSTL